MKKIKYLSLFFAPLAVTPFVTTSCSSITKQLNFNQESALLGNPEPVNTEFNNLDHNKQLEFIQKYNTNVNFVINDFTNWIRSQIRQHFFNSEGTQYIDKYNGTITVNADNSNSNKFNVSFRIDLLTTSDVILDDWYHFEGETSVEGTKYKIPKVRYFDLSYSNKVLSITDIKKENNINYVKYSSISGNENFSLSFKDDKLIPTEYKCTDTISFVELNTYTYQNWTFNN